MSTHFEIGKSYSFDVYPAQILGQRFEQATVIGIVDYHTASLYVDCHGLHAQVKSYVSGIPDTATEYYWLLLKLLDGQTTAIGMPWVNPDTIQLVTSERIQVIIKHTSATHIPNIRAQLVAAGFEIESIQTL